MTTLEVDIGLVDSRISQLFAKESVYDRQKSRLSDLLDQFLASLPTPKDLSTATPLDIVRFLVWKDGVGKTQVHVDGCRHRGLKGPFQCGCPTRLTAGTVDSMIGKLRAIFQEQDRAGDWESGFGLGNPAASLLVRKYLKHIREEQAAARVTPRQAVPLFVDKLARLVDHIDGRLEAARSDPLQTYILVRDQAYLRPCFFLGTGLEILVSCERMRFFVFLMTMVCFLTTHGVKRLGKGNQICSGLKDALILRSARWRLLKGIWRCHELCRSTLPRDSFSVRQLSRAPSPIPRCLLKL